MGSGLTKRRIDNTNPHPDRDIRLWDNDPRGFGVRVKSSGVKSFFIQYRSPATNKKLRHTIGQYGRLTLAEARRKAKQLLSDVECNGADPARERRLAKEKALSTIVTISELCENYMRDAWAGLVTYRGKPKKKSTLDIDAGRVRRHIVPVIGHKLVPDITKQDVERLFHEVRTGKIAVDEKTGPYGRARVTGGATTAARTIDLFGSMMTYAVQNELRPDNPVRGFKRPPNRKRDRVLLPEEYRRLGQALLELEKEGRNPVAIAAIRALALTGSRRHEIQSLKRSAIDAHRQCLRLADTKSGQQVRPIGKAALDALLSGPTKEGSPWVFPAAKGDGHTVDVKIFRRAVELASLEEIVLHSLRHSYASVALELEYSELTVAGLLGHRVHTVTARYAHHVDRALIAAADRVSYLIASRMSGEEQVTATIIPIARAEP